MIKILKEGSYSLIESKRQTKILILDNTQTFAWINIAEIGEILVTSEKEHTKESTLAVGEYRLYEVKDEPEYVDLIHLELSVGNGEWQGYLLPTGLPTAEDKRNRIIATDEVITDKK